MTLSGVENFQLGIYNVAKLPNGKYCVALNNGNMGAFMTDEAGFLNFKEKYENEHKMSYDEAKKVFLFGTGERGLSHNFKKNWEAIDVLLSTEAKWVKDNVRPVLGPVKPIEIKPCLLALTNLQEQKPALNLIA